MSEEINYTADQKIKAWRLLEMSLRILQLRKPGKVRKPGYQPKKGKPFTFHDVPGFNDFALGILGRSWFEQEMCRQDNDCGPDEFTIKARELLGLPPLQKLFGGEAGVKYPRWSEKPTAKELAVLEHLKLEGLYE